MSKDWITAERLKADLTNQLTVPLHPHVSMALGLCKGSTYKAAKAGEIETIRVGGALRVSTAWLRKKVGLETPRAA